MSTRTATATKNWNKTVGRLAAFVDAYGLQSLRLCHGNAIYGDLPGWLTRQKLAFADGKLSAKQIQKLEALGVNFDGRYSKAIINSWMQFFAAAKKLHAEIGHLRVPVDFVTADGVEIGRWLVNQRYGYHKLYRHSISEERIELLNNLHMVWNVEDVTALDVLADYVANVADPFPMSRYTVHNGFELGQWMANANKLYRTGNLDENLAYNIATIQSWDNISMMTRSEEKVRETCIAMQDYIKDNPRPFPITPDTVVNGVKLGRWAYNFCTVYAKTPVKHNRYWKAMSKVVDPAKIQVVISAQKPASCAE